ncbi:MAG: aminopeptidase [Nanoarchaeota archaeon]|nr:aminopeptidase [Nanoarchaeota archaeon]
MDIRTKKLAKLVAGYALKIKPKENVMISGGIEAQSFIIELYKEIVLRGAYPQLKVSFPGLSSFFYKYAQKHQIEKFPELLNYTVRKTQKYIGINTSSNTKELSNCDSNKIITRQKVCNSISEYICNGKPNIHRSTVAFPCLALAQEAEMDLTDYENFVYDACLQDWKKIGKRINKILKKFQKGNSVCLIGDGVDLKFDIHGEKAKSDLDGENIPMGEIFMAPVRKSIDGWIKFDYPAIKSSKEVTDIFLKFKEGKVIEATASKNEDFLKKMLNTDENASYVGEFGIGMNPKITKFTKNLLFDEKIGGTIHLALGRAYKENGGGNDSAIHWDIVKDISKAKIILDGKIVQKNGRWKI